VIVEPITRKNMVSNKRKIEGSALINVTAQDPSNIQESLKAE